MSDENFVPDACNVDRTIDGKIVRLSFVSNDGQKRNIVFSRAHIPALISQLLAQIEGDTVRPMNPGGVPIGTVFRLVGRSVKQLPDGGCQLTLHIEVPDGGRTIPMNLSKEDAEELARELTGG